MSLPKVVRVQQNFDATHVTDIPKTVSEQIGKLGLHSRVELVELAERHGLLKSRE